MAAGRYPSIAPNESGTLDVGDGQTLYWETVGDPRGMPVVFLHGGPGSGTQNSARRFFDPHGYRAVLFDQRGCGRSRPLADRPEVDLSINTTAHLLADIERLRRHLGIERWVVAGMSWGVTLALTYAEAHPDRVEAMVLGAVTSGTRREVEWITRDMGRVFPRAWDQFVSLVPLEERPGNLAAAYARLLASDDAGARDAAARAWCDWEDTHVSLMPGWQPDPRYQDPKFRAISARLVTHYWGNDHFLNDGHILDNIERIAHLRATLVHGRYDVSGPLDTAWELHKRWPRSRLLVVDDAGHGGGRFVNEFIAALDWALATE
jgi:proline iminopeptidase